MPYVRICGDLLGCIELHDEGKNNAKWVNLKLNWSHECVCACVTSSGVRYEKKLFERINKWIGLHNQTKLSLFLQLVFNWFVNEIKYSRITTCTLGIVNLCFREKTSSNKFRIKTLINRIKACNVYRSIHWSYITGWGKKCWLSFRKKKYILWFLIAEEMWNVFVYVIIEKKTERLEAIGDRQFDGIVINNSNRIFFCTALHTNKHW